MAYNELLVEILSRDTNFLKMLLNDMTDADLVQRPVPNANNALWQIGHLIASEAWMINTAAGKTIIELPAGFADRYKKETASVNDPAKLGTKADLLPLLEKAPKTCAWVATLSPADMAKPGPKEMINMIPTVGHLCHLFPAHTGMHVGQIQVLRRKLGKPVLF